MKPSSFLAILALLSACCVSSPSAGFADRIVSYDPGTGYATDFATGAGYTNTTSALGEPSRFTPGPFGGPVDPFNPPYLAEQILSIGTGGSLIAAFSTPIRNNPDHPYGIDFIVFGNTGFVITNGEFTGGGITDGSLFGANSGQTRISVSADNQTYFTLDTSLAPSLDGYFPTDGSANFFFPVDPSLSPSDFNGAGLPGIRELYAGSGGGTGFDLDWARDLDGNPAQISEVNFIRFEVETGAVEIDAIAAVPEPGTILLGAVGGLLLALSVCRRR